MILGLPVGGNDSIIVVFAVVADPDRHEVLLVLLMELQHRLRGVRKDLDLSVIHLCERLNLKVVSPDLILALTVTILFDSLVFISVDEVNELVTVGKDVVHALLTNKHVELVVAVNLQSDSPEETVAIASHLFDLELTRLQELLLVLLFLLFFLFGVL